MTFQRSILSGFMAAVVLVALFAACGSNNSKHNGQASPAPAASHGNNPMHLTIHIQPTNSGTAETIYLAPATPPSGTCTSGTGTITVSGTDADGHPQPAIPVDGSYSICGP